MAIATASTTVAAPRGADWISRMIETYRQRREAAAAAAELHGLSDRMLEDLGIARHDIDRVVREGYRR